LAALAVYTVGKTIVKHIENLKKRSCFYYILVFYMLKMQTINYLLWMAITRL